MNFVKALLQNRSGHVRNLEPEQIIDVDVSAVNYVCAEKEGCFLYINVGGNLVIKLIGDADFHTLVVPAGYECRMAVKEIDATTTCTGIKALF